MSKRCVFPALQAVLHLQDGLYTAGNMSQARDRLCQLNDNVIYLHGVCHRPADGAFITDAFHYFMGLVHNEQPYINGLLAQLYDQTGLAFIAACSGGAKLLSTHNRAANYAA